jgi:RNA polymerase sigma-70 factor (ECF subfamily)
MATPASADPRTDEQLLDAYRSGDDEALAALLARHAPAVQRFGLKMCRDPEDAKDVLQETLLAAARGAREFRGGSSLSTWLYTIARSFCIKKRRRASISAETLDDDRVTQIASPLAPPDEAAASRELGEALERAIGALEPMYREVLLLRDVEGLSAPEVAQVLGVGVDAVKSRLHRARVAVRDRLSPLLAPGAGPRSEACPDVVPLLSRYLEGEIGPQQCAEMERHVSSCPSCTAECDSLRRVLALCKAEARHGVVPADVQRAIQNALRALAP